MIKKSKNLHDIYIESALKDKISKYDFMLICETFTHLLAKSMIEGGIVYRLPHRLGSLGINKTKTAKKFYIDFKHYNATGEKIPLKNKHSQGYYARFRWKKAAPYAIFPYKKMFTFKPTRANKRYLAKCIKEKNTITKYFEHENTFYIN